jgi:hypothetical protein
VYQKIKKKFAAALQDLLEFQPPPKDVSEFLNDARLASPVPQTINALTDRV